MKYLSYYQKFNEDRKQLEIPFGGKDPLHGKPIHVHVIDALEHIELDKDPENYSTNEPDIDKHYKENFEEAFKMFQDDEEDKYEEELIGYMVDIHPPEGNEKLYNSEFIEELDAEDIKDDKKEIIERIEIQNLEYFLSKEGVNIFDNEIKRILFEERIQNSGFLDGISQDEDGIINIWRSIVFSKAEKWDTYQNILEYGGLGTSWSWDMQGAQAHWGGGVNGLELIIHAKVKPEYVDWQETIYKNGYYLNNEMEIAINDQENVLVYFMSKPDGGNLLDKKIDIEDKVVPV